MASTIFSVGLALPGNAAEFIPFRSDRSLFDGDIVLFRPSIASYDAYEHYAGRQLISESESVALTRDMAHWRSELRTAMESGKSVFVFLPKPEEAYYHTGVRSHSGTGRSRVTTQHVAQASSYNCLPISLQGLTARTGSEISSMGDLGPLAAYWSEFAAMSEYQVYFDANGVQPVLGTKKREKVVGAVVSHPSGGALILLPPLKWDEDALTYARGENTYWRKEGTALGKRIVGALVAISEARRRAGKKSPMPEWVLGPENQLAAERQTLESIATVEDQVRKLTDKRATLEKELEANRELYGLLYESGHALEHAILLALQLIGFNAEPFKQGESEFDAVFSSEEGRFLGEAEGKESKAINIDKMSQLERNLQEDFARDEVTEFAKGVLFGNAHRYTAPGERPAFFTEKCTSAAKRLGVALVRTPDLFYAARLVAETGSHELAAACRRAIFAAQGDIVAFPAVPEGGSGA